MKKRRKITAYKVVDKAGYLHGVFHPNKLGKLAAEEYAEKLDSEINKVNHTRRKYFTVVRA
jgi:hypothetical protein